jgi:alkylation response protein AidB-like acyl-CoA dehydrogenase
MIPYLSPEQLELRAQLRRFLVARSPLAEARRLMTSELGYDPGVWRLMAGQLGLQSLGVGERFGGSGDTYIELCLAVEEMGYALTASPFLSCAIAACALQAAGNPATTGPRLTKIVAGDSVATLCVSDDDGTWSPGDHLTGVESPAGAWALSGHTAFVLDGLVADLLVAVATVEGRPALFALDSHQPGVQMSRQPALDETRRLARVEFSGARAQLVALDGAGALVSHVLDMVGIFLAAESLGGARRCLDMSVEYAKQREQFGRPIGSFQAIKFKCADMLVRIEGARSIVFYASRLAGSEPDRHEIPVVASMAKAYCTDAYFDAAAECLQIHGGIGFTWEHDAHLFFKRASSSRLLFGSPEAHRERVVERLGLGA